MENKNKIKPESSKKIGIVEKLLNIFLVFCESQAQKYVNAKKKASEKLIRVEG
jgi:hypothetical protein